MKSKKLPDISLIIICLMVFFAVPGTAKSFAMGETSRTDHLLAPGVTESTVYVTVDGGYNVRTHILRISSDAAVELKASYGGYYGELNTADDRKETAADWDDGDWTFESVREQAEDYSESADAEGEVIAATNGDFFDLETGEPEGDRREHHKKKHKKAYLCCPEKRQNGDTKDRKQAQRRS